MATPLDGEGRLDHPALSRLLQHILSHPVQGLCPAGTTGEGPLLSRQFRARLTAAVVDLVPTGTPVIPAAVATTISAVQEDLRAYADVGASAVLVGVPYYYLLSEAAICRWYEVLAEDAEVPLLLYNIPSKTKLTISPTVIEKLATHEQIAGMKDSSKDLEYFQRVREVTSSARFSLFSGTDTLLIASAYLGGDGLIGAAVNLVPELVTQLWSAALDGRRDLSRDLQRRLVEIVEACRRVGSPVGWKTALSLVGLCAPHPAFPLEPASLAASNRLAGELRELGVVRSKQAT
jgi:dihydrodipicolinate synthase/N-acetylneuraminate lyase